MANPSSIGATGAAGAAGYAGIRPVTLTSRGQGERLTIFGRWPAGTKAGTYFIVWNDSGTLKVLGKFIVPVGLARHLHGRPYRPGTGHYRRLQRQLE